jgi:hypothetical protein
MQNIYVVTQVIDTEDGGSPFVGSAPCDSPESAVSMVKHFITEYVDEYVNIYPKEFWEELRPAWVAGDVKKILELWNDRSSCQIFIEVDELSISTDEVEFPYDETEE